MGKTNTSPLSGTRDFLPLDVLRRKYVVNTVERVYQSYGFEPLETPTLERLDTLLGKYGEEGDQLIFRVLKRGEKLNRILESGAAEDNLSDSGLRYDLTVPLARVAAEYQGRIPRVFKRYQIQPVFRADRPAKGRFREFYQCDLDIVGSTSNVVEVEVLNAAAEVLQALGFTSIDFRIQLNHRKVLWALMSVAGVQPEKEEGALVALDKLDKIGKQKVKAELIERGISEKSVQFLMDMLSEVPESDDDRISWLRGLLKDSEEGLAGTEELEEIVRLSQGGPVAKHLRINPYLARGLSYYTGPIFEVEFSDFAGSAGGGGRYDQLIGMFSTREIPACGFSLGLERVLLILEQRNLFPARLAGQPEVLVTQFSEETISESLAMARLLRAAGLRVDVYPEPGKYGKQFKYADFRGVRYALLLSPHEIGQGTVSVKDLKTGLQEEVPSEGIVEWLEHSQNKDREPSP
jgi:histidyl-tRNA synthetase